MRVLMMIGLLSASSCWAQEPTQANQSVVTVQQQPQQAGQQAPQQEAQQQPQPPATPEKRAITVPAGTRISLVLTSPIGTGVSQVGDPVRAVTDFPVSIDNALAIPAGTYVEGQIGAVVRSHHAGIEMRFTRLIFANGYAAPISEATVSASADKLGANSAPTLDHLGVSGTAEVSDAGEVGDVRGLSDVPRASSTTAWSNANVGREAQTLQLTPASYAIPAEPQQMPTPPTLPPLPKLGPSRGAVLGIGLAAAGGVVLAVILLARNHQGRGDIYFQAGWKFDLILQTPLTLDTDSVAAAASISNR
jgi:hypothetical protein